MRFSNRCDIPAALLLSLSTEKPSAVLIDAEVFEKKLGAVNLGILLTEAEAEVKNGNTRPARDFLEEKELRKKVKQK
ncbi:hypothetical protein LLG07_08420 [bacterium]|nr:hypothetical protein [bacterium]